MGVSIHRFSAARRQRHFAESIERLRTEIDHAAISEEKKREVLGILSYQITQTVQPIGVGN